MVASECIADDRLNEQGAARNALRRLSVTEGTSWEGLAALVAERMANRSDDEFLILREEAP